MNRTVIRGVTAGVVGTGLVLGATVAGPSIAKGAESDLRYSAPMSDAQQEALLDWTLPSARYLRHVHRVRHETHAASRTTYRAPLTGDPRTIGRTLLFRAGGTEGEWTCLETLWDRESGWSTSAVNAGSGAYGIPQALPGAKMAAAGSDWQTNPITQISWGISYIRSTYGDACNALAHSQSSGYY